MYRVSSWIDLIILKSVGLKFTYHDVATVMHDYRVCMLGLPATDVKYIWHEISLRHDHKHCNDVTKLQFSKSTLTATTVYDQVL